MMGFMEALVMGNRGSKGVTPADAGGDGSPAASPAVAAPAPAPAPAAAVVEDDHLRLANHLHQHAPFSRVDPGPSPSVHDIAMHDAGFSTKMKVTGRGPIFDTTPLGTPSTPFSANASTSVRARGERGYSHATGGMHLGVSLMRTPPKARRGAGGLSGPPSPGSAVSGVASPSMFALKSSPLHGLHAASPHYSLANAPVQHRPMESTAPHPGEKQHLLATEKYRSDEFVGSPAHKVGSHDYHTTNQTRELNTRY
jgi:hypothetical protein